MKPLREWRLAKVFSIGELAKASGVTRKTIIQIEHGRQLPRPLTIRRLSEALDVEPTAVEEFRQALDALSKYPALSELGQDSSPVADATATGLHAV